MGEGWKPLCDFLEVPVPEGKKFPRTNDTDGFVDRCRRRNRMQMMNVLFRVGVVSGESFEEHLPLQNVRTCQDYVLITTSCRLAGSYHFHYYLHRTKTLRQASVVQDYPFTCLLYFGPVRVSALNSGPPGLALEYRDSGQKSGQNRTTAWREGCHLAWNGVQASTKDALAKHWRCHMRQALRSDLGQTQHILLLNISHRIT